MKFRRLFDFSVSNNGQNIQRFLFQCPGCETGHAVNTSIWTWNGSFEKPTFTPSILVNDVPDGTNRCHSFVTDGKIQFLDDCWHKLKGQTVELPSVEFMYEDPVYFSKVSPYLE